MWAKDLNTCTCICTHMGTKTISIMDDVHRLLVVNRYEDESFSDVIRRTLKKKRKLSEFAGVWNNISDKEIEEINKNIMLLRKRATEENVKRQKR